MDFSPVNIAVVCAYFVYYYVLRAEFYLVPGIQDILARGLRRDDTEPDDVFVLEAGRHHVDLASGVDDLEEALRVAVVSLQTEYD